MDVYVYKKKELQLSYFSICEGKKLDDKIVTYFALKTGSTVYPRFSIEQTWECLARFARLPIMTSIRKTIY